VLLAAVALQALHTDALNLPEELQQAVQCYVLGSGSQVNSMEGGAWPPGA
jgi:hypothetical protein